MYLNATALAERLTSNDESVLVYNDAQSGTGINADNNNDDAEFFKLFEQIGDDEEMDAMTYEDQRKRGMLKLPKMKRDAMTLEEQRNEPLPISNLGQYLIENASGEPPMGVPTLNFANPFDTPSPQGSSVVNREGNYVNNSGLSEGIGLPQLEFANPFA